MSDLSEKWWERPASFITDNWWWMLLILVLILTAYFTRAYWIPLLGLS